MSNNAKNHPYVIQGIGNSIIELPNIMQQMEKLFDIDGSFRIFSDSIRTVMFTLMLNEHFETIQELQHELSNLEALGAAFIEIHDGRKILKPRD